MAQITYKNIALRGAFYFLIRGRERNVFAKSSSEVFSSVVVMMREKIYGIAVGNFFSLLLDFRRINEFNF